MVIRALLLGSLFALAACSSFDYGYGYCYGPGGPQGYYYGPLEPKPACARQAAGTPSFRGPYYGGYRGPYSSGPYYPLNGGAAPDPS